MPSDIGKRRGSLAADGGATADTESTASKRAITNKTIAMLRSKFGADGVAFEEEPTSFAGYRIARDRKRRALTISMPQKCVELAREMYAAAVFDAACMGISLPPIDPLYDVTPLCGAPDDGQGESAPVPLDEIFDTAHNHSMISVPDDALGAKVFADGTVSYLSAFGDLVLLAKKRTSPDIYTEKEMKGQTEMETRV